TTLIPSTTIFRTHDINQRLRIDTEDQHQQRGDEHHNAPRAVLPVRRRIAVELLRRAQVQAHRYAQVVVETNRGADNDTRRQPPQTRLHTDGQHVELTDKAQRHRDTRQ